MAKAKPFKLVFKRGGDTPAQVEKPFDSVVDAVVAAGKLHQREVKAGWTTVQLSYEVWNMETQQKVRDKIVQRAK